MAAQKTEKKTTKKTAAKPKAGVETHLVRRVTNRPVNTQIQAFRTGDTVNVFVKVKEGEKERTQVYKGIVTKTQGDGGARSFTVRKVSAGVGVERTFPFTSPIVEKVELVATGKVRRSKLYFLRGLEGKAAKIQSEMAVKDSTKGTAAAAAAPAAESTETPA